MGLIQQSSNLLEEFSAVENVAFPLLFDGMKRTAAFGLAAEVLELIGMADRANADVRSLSGGESQRIAVGRALVQPNLSLIVADEPTASLDAENALAVTALLLGAARSQAATVVLATHDPTVAAMCERTFFLTRERDAA